MQLKSKNPFLSNKSFSQPTTTVYNAEGKPVEIIDYNNTMTIQGAVNKSFILLALLVLSASYTWWMAYNGQNPLVLGIAGAIIGFIAVLITVFKPKTAPYLAPAYAVFEGLFIGAISAIIEANYYPGIALQAVGATFVTFLVCFLLYRFRIVKVTEQFKSVVIASTLAIATYYFLSFILSFFGVSLFHHGSSMLSIGFSAFVVVIAALNLFMDFDLIEQGAKRSLPKYMEWFGAMGLIITLVWLYLEILRLLSKLSSRN
jgi:uncharacterized YccA/Bax inhibitor family protein